MSGLLLRPFPFPVLLALRYLRSTRRDAFASFLSAVAAGGLALGVAALILSLAVISGFQDALRAELLGRTPQIEVDLPTGLPTAQAEAAREAVRRVSGVLAAQVQVRGGGWVVEAGKVQAVDLVGFEGQVPKSFPGAAGQGEGLYVPAALAARWGLVPGRAVDVVSPRPTLTPFGPQPRIRSLPLTGTYQSGRTQEERERVALPRAVAETLLGGDDRRLEVVATDLDTALDVAGRLEPVLPHGSVVRTWKELNRPLLFALHLEKAVMFVAVSLIIVVAALALVADLALIISSKRSEIGILGTMGATPATLRRAFLLLGGLVAGLGMLTGTILGVGGAWTLDHYKLLPVPGRVYFLDYVPFLVQPGDLALVLGLAAILALASAFYAARRAAALDPVEAMRR
ncbi:MAG TPA: FtsX-like permease family protein [Thermoanaerobaculia bacterium]|jgi:lipoprotein-releasing system permease protein|nr:FtsX-like permease family protein [Thermoanaerobaculia bacterium]